MTPALCFMREREDFETDENILLNLVTSSLPPLLSECDGWGTSISVSLSKRETHVGQKGVGDHGRVASNKMIFATFGLKLWLSKGKVSGGPFFVKILKKTEHPSMAGIQGPLDFRSQHIDNTIEGNIVKTEVMDQSNLARSNIPPV